jgi:acyl-CoA thioesterase-1
MKSVFCLFCLSIFFLACNSKPKQSSENKEVSDTKKKESAQQPKKEDKKTILFFGNSLTAGYGLDKEDAFPALIQDKIDSLGLDYTVVNGGLSGETSSGGKERINWVLRSPVDVFILELGPNDMLRGLNLEETKKNLSAILDAVIAKNSAVKIIIAGMTAPPNMGPEYVNEFTQMYPNLAKKYSAGLVPFLLEDVAGIPELNLEDQKHPNAEGQKIVAENVWAVLEEYL